jgi:hypothetical protein
MMNSIRPDALASLLGNGEAQNGNRPVEGATEKNRDLSLESTVSSQTGMHGVVGDRMVRSWSGMNQGSRFGEGADFMAREGPKNRARKVTEPSSERRSGVMPVEQREAGRWKA